MTQQLNEGDTFTIGPKRYRVEGGVPVEVVEQRGPLGGNLKPLSATEGGYAMVRLLSVEPAGRGIYLEIGGYRLHTKSGLEALSGIKVETDIPADQPVAPQQKRVDELDPGDEVWVNLHYVGQKIDGYQFREESSGQPLYLIDRSDIVYTYPKAPTPQPSGQRMTAAEAARVPGIVGRKISLDAVVYESNSGETPIHAYVLHGQKNTSRVVLHESAVLTLLPEAGDAS